LQHFSEEEEEEQSVELEQDDSSDFNFEKSVLYHLELGVESLESDNEEIKDESLGVEHEPSLHPPFLLHLKLHPLDELEEQDELEELEELDEQELELELEEQELELEEEDEQELEESESLSQIVLRS